MLSDTQSRYRAYLIAVRKRSPLTAEVYLRESAILERFLAARGSRPEAATSADLLGYLVWRQSGAREGDGRRERGAFPEDDGAHSLQPSRVL